MGGYAKTIKTESGYRPQTNFIIEPTGNEDRQVYASSEHSDGARLQRLRKSINDCDNGSGRAYDTGGIVKANGIDIGKSTEFFRGEYVGKSRTLRADNTSGVVLWKD